METHVGRSWSGHPIEDECPCPQAECGLVIQDRAHPDCTEHPVRRDQTMRQAHTQDRCPGAPRTPGPSPARLKAAALRRHDI